MGYKPEKYSDNEFFLKIEKILNRMPDFIDDKERELYFRARFESFKKNLLDRFSLIVNQANYFLIEENYTEHTWKELHALHYTNTNYTYGNKVMRVHFWNQDIYKELSEYNLNQDIVGNGYLGYVTLRPLPDYNLMLSFIIPNWSILRCEKISWIMTYERDVHIAGFDISIRTTPFYFQDTVYIRCAHADMLMFSLFLHHAYKFPRLSVADMIENNRYYPVPSGGLEYGDMLDIFYRNKIPVSFYFKPEGDDASEGKGKCIAVLNAHLESRLPVIIYNDHHVVLVIGHTDEEVKRYVIYDDSGYFLSEINRSKNFVGIVRAEDLFPDKGQTYMIAATYERVYLNPQEYFGFLDKYLLEYEKEQDDEFPEKSSDCRNIIVDNTLLKHFLRCSSLESNNSAVVNRMEELFKIDLPHYLWYSEYNCDDYRYILVADPTYPSGTKENIFPYGGFYCSPEGNGISLLTKVEEI